MTPSLIARAGLACLLIAVAADTARAHITPPVVLVSDRDAVVSLLAGARKFFVRELRLSADDSTPRSSPRSSSGQ